MTVTFSPVRIEATPVDMVARFGLPETCLAHVESALSVNISSFNGGEVLDLLGYPRSDEGLVGSASADDFLGRTLVALAMCSSCEVPGYVDETPGCATTHVVTRQAGYLPRVLGGLCELAQACVADGSDVGWA